MKTHKKKMFISGLLTLFSIVSLGAAPYLINGKSSIVESDSKRISKHVESLSKDVPENDIELLRAELKRLKSGVEDLEVSTNYMRSTIREHGQSLNTVIANADSGNSPFISSEKNAAAPELTYEEEMELADAQIQAEIELINETILTEDTDPEWSVEAEVALEEAYRNNEMEMVEFVNVECRTTLCRIELLVDESAASEESFGNISHLTPWEGEGFMRVDEGENAQAVVYIAREGYSLPQYVE